MPCFFPDLSWIQDPLLSSCSLWHCRHISTMIRLFTVFLVALMGLPLGKVDRGTQLKPDPGTGRWREGRLARILLTWGCPDLVPGGSGRLPGDSWGLTGRKMTSSCSLPPSWSTAQALECHVCAYNGDNCFKPMRCPAMATYCMTTRTCESGILEGGFHLPWWTN